jgi:hypothetical protein
MTRLVASTSRPARAFALVALWLAASAAGGGGLLAGG